MAYRRLVNSTRVLLSLGMFLASLLFVVWAKQRVRFEQDRLERTLSRQQTAATALDNASATARSLAREYALRAELGSWERQKVPWPELISLMSPGGVASVSHLDLQTTYAKGSDFVLPLPGAVVQTRRREYVLQIDMDAPDAIPTDALTDLAARLGQAWRKSVRTRTQLAADAAFDEQPEFYPQFRLTARTTAIPLFPNEEL